MSVRFVGRHDLARMPRPRLIWSFADDEIELGVALSDADFADVVGGHVVITMSRERAQRVAGALDWVGARVCRALGEHKWDRFSFPENSERNPRDHLFFEYEYCMRCGIGRHCETHEPVDFARVA